MKVTTIRLKLVKDVEVHTDTSSQAICDKVRKTGPTWYCAHSSSGKGETWVDHNLLYLHSGKNTANLCLHLPWRRKWRVLSRPIVTGLRVRCTHGRISVRARARQWRRQNFSAAGAQWGHQNLDWGTFKKLSIPSLFLVEAELPPTL